jgi:phage head maturation protease
MAALYAREPSASRSGQMQSKTLERVEVKSADRGEVSAVFSTFNVVDKDNDVTLPGAYTEGAEVVISAYEHKSWGGALPVGKGRIRTTRTEAILDGQFFMDTTAGRDTFAVVKQLGAQQQWSYGYEVIDAEPGTFDGKEVRFLKRLEVPEVSPVLVGAGIDTRTLAVKTAEARSKERATVSDYAAAIRPHEAPVSAKAWDFPAAGDLIPEGATIDQLRALHAWVDPAADPGVKASYGFLHHDADGKANLRACLAGVGVLNGTKGQAMADAERRATWNHLAAHLDDGDIEAPEIRGESGGITKQNDELAVILADLAAGRMRAWETKRSRSLKGKALGATTVLILEWIGDEMRALKSLLDSPQEDADREYARFIASQLPDLGETA